MKKKVSTDNFINPEPYTIISCRSKNGRDNALTVGFIGNVSFEPRIIMIAISPERYSHDIIQESKEFVVNIPTMDYEEKVLFFGTESGRNQDKLKNINTMEAQKVDAVLLSDCPVNFECTVVESVQPGTHTVFFGKVEEVHCDEEYLTESDGICWDKIDVLHSLIREN